MKRKLLSILLLLFAGTTHAQPWAQLVKDACPGSCGSQSISYYTLNNKIYFRGSDTVHGDELWVTDGTASGTNMLKDLTPATGESSDIGPFTECNNKLYFTGRLTGSGSPFGVYVTDGTTTGSFSLTNVENYGFFVPYNNEMYFGGSDLSKSTLFKTDGTTAGTLPLYVNPIPGVTRIDYNIVYNGKLFLGLVIGDEAGLFTTDGTTPGTHMVLDAGLISSINILNGKMYFFARTAANAIKLYESDGTTSGTHELSQNDILFSDLYVNNNKLYFVAASANAATELWVSDGTQAGTQAIKQIACNNTDHLYFLNNKVIIPCGRNLLVSDGTTQGTYTIPVAADVSNQVFIRNNKLYATTFYRFGYKIFVSDGTMAGTHYLDTSVIAQNHYTDEHTFITFNNKTYFEGIEVVQGTTRPLPGRHMLCYIDDNDKIQRVAPAITTAETQFSYAILDNSLYIAANDSLSGIELWKITDFPTGINEATAAKENIIYPNPATNTFSIKNNSNNTTVRLLSITGQLLLQTQQTTNIDIAHIPTGIYQVQLISDGQTHMQKLIKE
ncbi:MAG: T9SS type A sorting domain-containing protein [Sphingobacteriales bacterium]|nr:MAG: T9SS type A sorting domain-containing protein [Sphingobacteriales bacterium]